MKKILGPRASGKTIELVKSEIQNSAVGDDLIFVVGNEKYIQGIVDGLSPVCRTTVMSYKDFLKKRQEMNSSFTGFRRKIFIDEVEGLLKALCDEIKGYTLSIDNFIINSEV